MYLEGNGVTRDINVAVKWLKKSADHGCEFGQNDLGVQYQDGVGVPQDLTKAYQYYLLAAKKGNARSMLNVARMYMGGFGVPRDAAKAVQWYTKASQNGFKLADSEIELAKQNMETELKEFKHLNVEEWEQSTKADTNDLTIAERIDRFTTTGT
jgi:TPR repeat protein